MLPLAQALPPALWGLSTSFALCLLLVLTKRWHGKLTLDSTAGVQKFHTAPTPRVGGIPIALGLVVAWSQASAEVKELLGPLLIAGLPAFIFGTAEDLTKRVGVRERLLATMASGVLAWWLTGISLTRVDVWGMDAMLTWLPLSVAFTAFAVGGVANAVNIIDGFNGLASSTVMLALLGYAGLAVAMGDGPLAAVCLVLAFVVAGFFWVNWPLGKIFLGDGGSYFIGFALAWLAVLLVERHPVVSPFAVLLVCIHPVTEVLFSVYRRKVRHQHPGMPDRLHFHSLVKRRYVRRWFPGASSAVRNSITGLLVGMMTLTAVLLAQWVYDSVLWSVAAVAALGMGYVAMYARMVRFRWCSPVNFIFVKPASRPA